MQTTTITRVSKFVFELVCTCTRTLTLSNGMRNAETHAPSLAQANTHLQALPSPTASIDTCTAARVAQDWDFLKILHFDLFFEEGHVYLIPVPKTCSYR